MSWNAPAGGPAWNLTGLFRHKQQDLSAGLLFIFDLPAMKALTLKRYDRHDEQKNGFKVSQVEISEEQILALQHHQQVPLVLLAVVRQMLQPNSLFSIPCHCYPPMLHIHPGSSL